MSTGKAPTLYHMRARSLTSKLLDLDSSPACPSPPPFRSHVTVPFLWEDAPGKPKLRAARPSALLLPSAATATASPVVLADGGPTARVAGGHEDGAPAHARPVLLKLKLPPRLQAAEHPLSSPKTVLQGPYFGGGNKPPRPLRRIARTASCQMSLRGGGGLFVWRKGAATATASAGSKEGGHCQLYAVAPDGSCLSPAASSASSSSSSSMSYFFDDNSRRQADGREDSEDGEVGDDGRKGSVRITRFRRNRSLPTMSRSHLWANIRKGVKQISPWSYKPT
ncbi:uncharacterized protein LOC125549443 [Triticum urartu]|uniref:Uncharacterized protein n=1 Tax=Triticum turgidum subsp. durum TaxID=4567 RepID=A0A9R0RZS7_TRITD|nr:uncharacterized protein LOC119273617 [Triticum dicoccoides]XP_048568811.1 uncharacterized protein LOC125549443 [Triticum urartu]VAH69854.1 unnamed protein product [Triticum turgidum subsp. durum]